MDCLAALEAEQANTVAVVCVRVGVRVGVCLHVGGWLDVYGRRGARKCVGVGARVLGGGRARERGDAGMVGWVGVCDCSLRPSLAPKLG